MQPSGSEVVVRLYAEAESSEQAMQLAQIAAHNVREEA